MAELARGAITDRPWGRTLGTLGLRGVTGQLSLGPDARRFHIAFVGGNIAGATSPLASDAAVRIALTSGLVSSTQVADIARRQAAAPRRDEIEVISERARLAPDQALRLRRRAIAQRAARTFAIERGDFIVDDQITLPLVAGAELDIRSVLYLGAHQYMSESRLEVELAQFGAWFRLRAEAVEDLPQFGFANDVIERAVIDRLRACAAVEELEALGEVQIVRAMIYALASCNACEIQGPRAQPRVPIPQPTHPTADGSRRMATTPPHGSIPLPRRPTTDPPARRPTTNPPGGPRRRLPTSRPPATRTRQKADSAQSADVRKLIAKRLELLKSGVDHYQLLGLKLEASPDDVRKAYFALARQLHPDRLSALGIVDTNREAHRLFAQVNTAFAVLSDSKRRFDYTQMLRRGGEAAVRADEARAAALANRILEAEEAYTRGEMALRRDQIAIAIAELQRAIELNPDEADYHALLAWAQFCAAPDKMAVAASTRVNLDRAIAKSPRAVLARFYLGRVERMLGREPDALRHFQEVLRLQPQHVEAAAEVRVLESRLSGPDKGGLFNRKR